MFAFGEFPDACWSLMFFFGLFWLAMKRLSMKHDADGKIKGAAKEGVIRLIARWMK